MTACDDAVLIVINTAGCKSKTNETTSLQQHNDIISRRRAHSAQYASGELLGQTASLGGVG